ncbi:MAG: SDR family NAD(P)-dependent oxidoreductase [Candidatus Rokuibacteriota bacterium]
MMPPFRRARKVRRRALVTGGAIRVGRAIALALARAGFDVAIGYHRSAAAANRTVRELEALGARAVALRVNLAAAGAPRRLVDRAARRLGGLDVLVNNAAGFTRTPLATTTERQYARLLDLNLKAAYFTTQAAARWMRAGGHVVSVGDAAALSPDPGWVPYGLSKAGLVALTRGLAAELAPRRIAVNCVAPGPVLKPDRLPLARWRAIRRGRAGDVDEVAAAVVVFVTCPPRVTGRVQIVGRRRRSPERSAC